MMRMPQARADYGQIIMAEYPHRGHCPEYIRWSKLLCPRWFGLIRLSSGVEPHSGVATPRALPIAMAGAPACAWPFPGAAPAAAVAGSKPPPPPQPGHNPRHNPRAATEGSYLRPRQHRAQHIQHTPIAMQIQMPARGSALASAGFCASALRSDTYPAAHATFSKLRLQ